MFTVADIPPIIADADYVTTVPTSLLARWMEEYRESCGIDMDPDFQRGHVWTDINRTRYIEHLLRGGRSGKDIYWNCPNHDGMGRSKDGDLPPTMCIVDGKQRLTTILAFVDDQVEVFDGRRLSDFDADARKQALGATGRLRLQMHVHSLVRKKDLLRWYLDLNEGQVPHSPDELDRVRGMLADLGERD